MFCAFCGLTGCVMTVRDQQASKQKNLEIAIGNDTEADALKKGATMTKPRKKPLIVTIMACYTGSMKSNPKLGSSRR